MKESLTNLCGIQLPPKYCTGFDAIQMGKAANQLARVEWHVAKPLAKSGYGQYLLNIINERVF